MSLKSFWAKFDLLLFDYHHVKSKHSKKKKIKLPRQQEKAYLAFPPIVVHTVVWRKKETRLLLLAPLSQRLSEKLISLLTVNSHICPSLSSKCPVVNSQN